MLKNSKLFTSFLIVIAASLLFYLFDILYQPESKESQTAETTKNSSNYKVGSIEFNTYQTYEEETFQYQEKELEREKEKKIKELIVRCEEFGFEGDNNIAACVQREVKVDLAFAKQQEEINRLENRINSLAQKSKQENSSDWLVDLLTIISDEADRQREMEQTVRIHRLESRVNAQKRSNNTKHAMCVMNSKNC